MFNIQFLYKIPNNFVMHISNRCLIVFLLTATFLKYTLAFTNYVSDECQFDMMWNTEEEVQSKHPDQSRCGKWIFSPYFTIFRHN